MRNVTAAGGCDLITRGHAISLSNPRIIADPARRWALPPVRAILGLIGATHYMRLTRVT